MLQKKKWYFGITLLFLFFLFWAIYFSYQFYQKKRIVQLVRPHIYVEYGHTLGSKDIFVTYPQEDFSFSTNLESFHNIGDYTLFVSINQFEIPCEIHIIDSTPPVLEVHSLTKYLDENEPNPEEFVTFCEDLSGCFYESYSFERKVGTQNIDIVAFDKFGNRTKKSTELTFLEDLDGPIFDGLLPLTVIEGHSINLTSNVRAIDARFGDVEFSVDDSKVNYYRPGTYHITYIAKDPLGNQTIQTRKIVVKPKAKTYMISNFPTYSQYPEFPNGCETIALYNLLRYYQISVTPNELINALPKGPGPHFKNNQLYGGNPEKEFVGDPRDIHGYGVYQKPIIQLANQFKPGMIDYTGHSLHEVLSLVKQNIPVQVWGSIGMKNTGVCTSWTDTQSGKQINWICDLHSVVIVGFNSTTIYVSDSFSGKIEGYSFSKFEKMYNLFGKRAIYFPN